MSKPNELNYQIARDFVAAGKWRVDAERGYLIGVRGKPMARVSGSGYVQVSFRDPDDYTVQRFVVAHRVIWEAVRGPLGAGLEINHINGNKTDNRLVNLEAVTPSQNTLHANRTGLRVAPRGAACKRGHFTDAYVLDIYRRLRAGETPSALATELGVGIAAIKGIASGQRWGRVTAGLVS